MIDEFSDYTPSWTFGFHHQIYLQYASKGWTNEIDYHGSIQWPSQIHFVRDVGKMTCRHEDLTLLAIL